MIDPNILFEEKSLTFKKDKFSAWFNIGLRALVLPTIAHDISRVIKDRPYSKWTTPIQVTASLAAFVVYYLLLKKDKCRTSCKKQDKFTKNCVNTCYVNAIDATLKLLNRDLKQAQQLKNPKLIKKVQKEITKLQKMRKLYLKRSKQQGKARIIFTAADRGYKVT